MGNPVKIAKSIAFYMKKPNGGQPPQWANEVGQNVANTIFEAIKGNKSKKEKGSLLKSVLEDAKKKNKKIEELIGMLENLKVFQS